MKFTLSNHAQEVLEERGIPIGWVEQVLFSPTRSHPDPNDDKLEHRLGAISEYGNRVLRVVLNKELEPVKIITAYFDRKMKGKL